MRTLRSSGLYPYRYPNLDPSAAIKLITCACVVFPLGIGLPIAIESDDGDVLPARAGLGLDSVVAAFFAMA